MSREAWQRIVTIAEKPTLEDGEPRRWVQMAEIARAELAKGDGPKDSLNQRGWDLLRQMRHELFVKEELITPEEFSLLAQDHPAVARLEDYDEARARIADLERTLASWRDLVDDYVILHDETCGDDSGGELERCPCILCDKARSALAAIPAAHQPEVKKCD